jgi:polysaccharide biosynthesis/export protein
MRAIVLALAACIVAAALSGFGVGPAYADDSYHLGEGDVVRLTVFQRPDLSTEARLGTNGRIDVPGGGKLDIGGMTIPQAEAKIVQLLAHAGGVPNPQVDLQVGTYGSQKVSVFGYVKANGSYALDRPMHVSEVLALAGGILPDGSEKVILVREGDDGADTRTVINMRDVLDGSDTSADVPVKAGDIINVPRAPRVYVYGSVNHPGPYILEDGMTTLQVISLAGGLSPTGSDSRLEVVRNVKGKKSPQSIKVNLEDKLQPEDTLIVHESIF